MPFTAVLATGDARLGNIVLAYAPPLPLVEDEEDARRQKYLDDAALARPLVGGEEETRRQKAGRGEDRRPRVYDRQDC